MNTIANIIDFGDQSSSKENAYETVRGNLVSFRLLSCEIAYDLAVYLAKTGWHAEQNADNQVVLRCLGARCMKVCTLSSLNTYYHGGYQREGDNKINIHKKDCPYHLVTPIIVNPDPTYKELWCAFDDRFNSFQGRNYKGSNLSTYTQAAAAASGFHVLTVRNPDIDGWSDDSLKCIRCDNTYNYRRSIITGYDNLDQIIKQHNGCRCVPAPRKRNPVFNPAPACAAAIDKSNGYPTMEDSLNRQVKVRKSLKTNGYLDNDITLAIQILYGNDSDIRWNKTHIIFVMVHKVQLDRIITMQLNHKSIIAVIKKFADDDSKNITTQHLVDEIFNYEKPQAVTQNYLPAETAWSAYPQQSNKEVKSESKREFPTANNNQPTNSTSKQLPARSEGTTISQNQSSTACLGAVEDKSGIPSLGASDEGLTTKMGQFSLSEKVSTNNVNSAACLPENTENSKPTTTAGHDPDTNCSLSPLNRDTECPICMTEIKDTIFYPCEHLSACKDCANKVSKCPTCHEPIRERAYLS